MRSQIIYPHVEVEFTNVTPVWLLPFWRLLRGDARGDYARAWKALPNHLPRGYRRPTVMECATILVDHGLWRAAE